MDAVCQDGSLPCIPIDIYQSDDVHQISIRCVGHYITAIHLEATTVFNFDAGDGAKTRPPRIGKRRESFRLGRTSSEIQLPLIYFSCNKVAKDNKTNMAKT